MLNLTTLSYLIFIGLVFEEVTHVRHTISTASLRTSIRLRTTWETETPSNPVSPTLPNQMHVSDQIMSLSTLSFNALIWPIKSLASLVVMLHEMTALLTPQARPRAILDGT